VIRAAERPEDATEDEHDPAEKNPPHDTSIGHRRRRRIGRLRRHGVRSPMRLATATAGHLSLVERAPSPARAERIQQRKLAFIPVWPVVAAIALVVAWIVFAH
jgi:hypothetical protein